MGAGRRAGKGPAGRGVGALSPSHAALPARGRGAGARSARRPARAGAACGCCQPRAPEPLAAGARRGAALGAGAPAPQRPPWSLRTKTPRRRRRRRTPGRPRPAGWWCRSARRRARCARPSPTCPSRWPSSASSSTPSCPGWVRRGAGEGCGGREGPVRPRQVAALGEAPGGRGAPGPPLTFSRP